MAFGALLISYEVFGTMFHAAINVLFCVFVRRLCACPRVSALLADTNVNQHHLYHCRYTASGAAKPLLGALRCNIILLFDNCVKHNNKISSLCVVCVCGFISCNRFGILRAQKHFNSEPMKNNNHF